MWPARAVVQEDAATSGAGDIVNSSWGSTSIGSYRGAIGEAEAGAYNWYDPVSGSRAPVDTDGNGTHVIGTVLTGPTADAPSAVTMTLEEALASGRSLNGVGHMFPTPSAVQPTPKYV
ncbi:MAG: hypothetical protein JWN72_2895 [Thermoleophilia bacterium]|nr:hypothetical protein [Thermoleophilia bacterium]